MKENKEKREFARQLEQISETLTQAVKNSEGRAYILIGIDRKEGEDGDTQGVIEGLANFFAEEKTAPLASEAMKLATLKKLSRLLETE